MAEILFNKSTATLRQIEKTFAQARLIVRSFNKEEKTHFNILFLLIYLKTFNTEVFNKIENNKLSLQELSDLFYELVYTRNIDSYGFNMLFTEAQLLWVYNNGQNNHNKISSFEKLKKDEYTLSSKLEKPEDTLIDYLIHFERTFEALRFPHSYLIDRINLISSLKS